MATKVVAEVTYAEMRRRARVLREEGLSFDDIADALGRTRATVKEWLTGEVLCPAEKTEIEVTIDDIVAFCGEPSYVEGDDRAATFDAKPLAAWVLKRRDEWGSWDLLALGSGLDVRILTRVVKQKKVSLRVIDEITTALDYTAALLYPEQYAEM